MSRLADVIDELRETSAEIDRVEAVIREQPAYESLRIDLSSVQKRQRRLEEEFRALTNEQQIDVVNYRLIPAEKGRVPISALAAALSTFQASVSTIFDALKNGPKKRGRLEPEAAALSSFDFAYAGTGSLSIAMTIPNDRLLVGETLLDQSVAMFFAAAQADQRAQILELRHIAGIPAVRRLYEWTGTLVGYGLDADIQWRRREQIRSRVTAESPRLQRLREIIEETSEIESDRVEITGVLAGLDVDDKTFHLKVPNADDIYGAWAEGFAYNADFRLEHRYVANLTKESKTYYAYEREEISWMLDRLRPVD